MGLNRYAAGNKVYGGGRPMPTVGRVDPLGYADRDLATKARRNALLRRMQASQKGDFMSSSWLGSNG
jgi:hypothetical protein